MDAVRNWNLWYDGLPELWRFPIVLGLLVLIGAINLSLTIATGFPFGLLVFLAILVLAAIRVPYALATDPYAATPAPPTPPHADWAHDWNRRYESIPELWRFTLIVGVLVLVGAFNMALTIAGGFPFGLLVLLAIVGIGAVRVPYVMGWGHVTPAHHEVPPAALSHEAALQAPAPAIAQPEARIEPPTPSARAESGVQPDRPI